MWDNNEYNNIYKYHHVNFNHILLDVSFEAVLMNAFSVFDSKNAISKISVVEGYHDASGNWIPEVETTTAINGHLSPVTLVELQYIDPAIKEQGVQKISVESSVGLEIGDKISVAGETNSWSVVSKLNTSGLLFKFTGVNRETFLMKKVN